MIHYIVFGFDNLPLCYCNPSMRFFLLLFALGFIMDGVTIQSRHREYNGCLEWAYLHPLLVGTAAHFDPLVKALHYSYLLISFHPSSSWRGRYLRLGFCIHLLSKRLLYPHSASSLSSDVTPMVASCLLP